MPRPRHLSPLPALDEAAVSRFLEAHGAKSSHLASILSAVVGGGVGPTLPQVPGLPLGLQRPLQANFTQCSSTLLSASDSTDGATTKLLIRLQDGLAVESVIMRHDPSAGKYAGEARPGSARATLCISSQVGCQMGCTFCATGSMGLRGDLSAGEILEQLLVAQSVLAGGEHGGLPGTPPCTPAIRNVVFMGMGEPLNNYEAVRQAVGTMTASYGFRLSPNHITISTVGVVPRLRSMAGDMPAPVNVALSLHAPSQELRQALVPAARAYPLPALMAALDQYQRDSGKCVFVEYVMLERVNDSPDIAHQLGLLLAGRNVVVNLIPYNSTDAAAVYAPSSAEALSCFQRILRGDHGIRTTVRRDMGRDIDGACGQLAVRHHRLPPEPDHGGGGQHMRPEGVAVVRDIEDLPASMAALQLTQPGAAAPSLAG